MNINGYTPQKNIRTKRLLSLKHTSAADIMEMLHLAKQFKRKKEVGEKSNTLSGKYVALMTKPSFFRTRIAFQIAVEGLCGNPITIPMGGSDIEEALKNREIVTAIKNYGIEAFVVDTAFFHDAELLESYIDTPVINANGNASPCQALAALLAIWERKGTLSGLKLAVIGDLNVSDRSIVAGAAKCGFDISVICPEECEPDADIINYCRQFCDIEVYNNIEDGVRQADVVYVMTHDFSKEFLLTDYYFKFMHKDALVLSPLPVKHDTEISDEIISSSHSLIVEQAENLLPVLQSVLTLITNK